MSKNRGQSAKRSETRANKLGRNFSNKKGVQLIINPYYDRKARRIKFTKITKRLQHLLGKIIVHYDYA